MVRPSLAEARIASDDPPPRDSMTAAIFEESRMRKDALPLLVTPFVAMACLLGAPSRSGAG